MYIDEDAELFNPAIYLNKCKQNLLKNIVG